MAKGFITIEVAGSPREMGRQYGEFARDEIRHNVDNVWNASKFDATEKFTGPASAVIERFAPDILEEMRGIAEGADIPLANVLIMNQFNTFTAHLPSPGCTSFALANSEDGPVLGKNNDLGLNYNRSQVIRISKPTKGLPMIQVGDAGWVCGFDAMNAEGLVNGHNSVGSVFDKRGAKIDLRLWGYQLMRTCRTTEEMLDRISTVPLTGKGYNIVVNDAKGDTCVIEAPVPLIATRNRGEQFVYATNHYVTKVLKDADMRQPDAKWITIYRFGYFQWVAGTKPPKNIKDVKAILSSHEPWAPCRHEGPHCSTTAWSIVGDCANHKLHVACGNPCSVPYEVFEV